MKVEELIVGISKATNRSIAGGSFAAIEGERTEVCDIALLGEWGVRLIDETDSDLSARYSFEYAESVMANPPAGKSAKEKIVYARAHMPCVSALSEYYAGKTIFDGIRIVSDLIIEPKTAVLLIVLKELGAEITEYCGASSVNPEVAEALKEAGIIVYADALATPAQDHASALTALDTSKPEIVLDDGANLTRLLYIERPELIGNLIGISEETTCGVTALEEMERDGTLRTPAIAVNDSKIKTQFDNVHGTGETVITTLIQISGESPKGKKVLVAGYGAVGFGLAKRFRALGANVAVSEVDPVAALRAVHDGFIVMPRDRACAAAGWAADWIITATGYKHTIRAEDLAAAKDGAVIASAGGSLNEIAIAHAIATYEAVWDVSDPDRCRLIFPAPTAAAPQINAASYIAAKSLTILSLGHGINYTSGDGNPIEIMDLSFAAQLESLAYIIKNKGKLPSKVLRLPEETSEKIAAIKLRSLGVEIDTKQDAGSWKETRFGNVK